MKSTVEKYAARIAKCEIDPVVFCSGRENGVVIDPTSDDVPVDVIEFGIYRLDDGPFTIDTAEREYAFVPIDSAFSITVDRKTFSGRRGGVFATLPHRSNTSVVYAPRKSKVTLNGSGEMTYYSAPSSKKMRARHIVSEQVEQLSVGAGPWRRYIVMPCLPGEVSTNIIIGETYSPPGLWSGVPPHIHDKDDIENGQSDHEEVYYHLLRFEKKASDQMGPYAVQTLFDGKNLNRAFMTRNRTAVAIPGVCHSLIAGPGSEFLYIWGLAGKETPLKMWDIPEFIFLRKTEQVLLELEEKRGITRLPLEEVKTMFPEVSHLSREWHVMESILRERGFVIS